MTQTLTPTMILPIRKVTLGLSDLDQFTLRDGIDSYLLNPHGAYGFPIVHADLDNQHVFHKDLCHPLTRSEVESLWANEREIRPHGLSAVQFCSMCVTNIHLVF